jgi:hypothetical protein
MAGRTGRAKVVEPVDNHFTRVLRLKSREQPPLFWGWALTCLAVYSPGLIQILNYE